MEDAPDAARGAEAGGEEQGGGPGRRVVVTHSDEGGRDFAEPVLVSGEDPDVAAALARVALGPDGEVDVLYERDVAA
ncbi:MAG: hypothetical protein ACRDY7_12775, partial [Acidimicrobiia bacterium]